MGLSLTVSTGVPFGDCLARRRHENLGCSALFLDRTVFGLARHRCKIWVSFLVPILR